MITRIKLTDGTMVTTDGMIEIARCSGMHDGPMVLIIHDVTRTGTIPWDKVVYIQQETADTPEVKE